MPNKLYIITLKKEVEVIVLAPEGDKSEAIGIALQNADNECDLKGGRGDWQYDCWEKVISKHQILCRYKEWWNSHPYGQDDEERTCQEILEDESYYFESGPVLPFEGDGK